MKKGIIYDMDGTVWDSSDNVAKSWTVKIHEAGYSFIHARYGFGTVNADVPFIDSFEDLIRVVPEIFD